MNMEKRIYPRLARIAAAALFMAAALAAFAGVSAAAPLMRPQFAPALLRCAAAFSCGALATVLTIAVLTWLFGRFYCAAFCPLGILQDLAAWLSRRRSASERDLARLRYPVAGIACGMLAAGWTLPFLLLDPYSNFGRMAASGFALGGLVPLALILALAVWKKRLYCTSVCPVGTLLGVPARHALLKLRLTDSCVKCGACVKVCPSGCVDPRTGVLDNERCVRCMNCVSVCRFGGVKFAFGGKAPRPVDPGRREFLLRSGLLIAGAAAGFAAARGARAAKTLCAADALKRRLRILPPGAGDLARFAAKCTACQLCTANCPAGIIVPAPGGDGPVELDPNRGACRYDCDNCSRLCPTGALLSLGLKKKQRTRIALAAFDPGKCLVFQEGAECGRCAKACPTGAVTLRKSGAPRFKGDKCIGCGACMAVCPAPEKAFRIDAVERQTELEA